MTSDPNTMADNEPLTFSYKNTKHLIQMIQARPCLWDRQSSEYKDRLARDRAWNEVFVELDPGYKTGNATVRHEIGSIITKKWYNIRDSYVKSLKPDCLGRRNRPYIHADFLRFLDDCYLDKLNGSHLEMLNNRSKRDIHEEIEEFDTDEVEPEPWEHKVLVSLEEEEPTSAKRPRLECSTDQNFNENTKLRDEDDIITILSNLIQKEEDEDRAFFKSITPSVKKLTEDSKFEFRIEVLKLIKSLRAKDLERITMKVEKISSNESESE